jgi:hypothetical protein
VAVTDVHLEMLGDAIDELRKVRDELSAYADAEDLDRFSALRPRLAQILANLWTAQKALDSPPVLGLQAERHGGNVISHN